MLRSSTPAPPTWTRLSAKPARCFPAGYRDFITRFGEGLLAGYIEVYPPHQILSGDNNLHAWRERIDGIGFETQAR